MVETLSSDPPTLGLGIRPHRYSYKLIEDSGEFVVNIFTEDILEETDFCGLVSGENVDKFSETELTPEPAEKVKPPLIRECPVNIESIIKKKIPLSSHHLFIGEIVRVHVDQDILNEKERVDCTKMAPFVYNQDEYWSLHQKIGVYGFSKDDTYMQACIHKRKA
jgi:flavin reductase (DIM6/NTAB) family NADH-FMN oxidoreductase RutF